MNKVTSFRSTHESDLANEINLFANQHGVEIQSVTYSTFHDLGSEIGTPAWHTALVVFSEKTEEEKQHQYNNDLADIILDKFIDIINQRF